MAAPDPGGRARALILLNLLLLAPVSACGPAAAQLDVPDEVSGGPPGQPGAGGNGGRGPGGTGASGGTPGGVPGAGGSGGTGSVPVPTEASLLPVRVRRLSNFEYDRSVAALFATSSAFGKAFAPDFRQSDFTQNAAQQVDSTFATQLQSAAQTVA